MKLSIIVPAFNEQGWLGHTLRRIQRAIDVGGLRDDTELVVVDNASNDRTAAVAEENGARVVRENHRGVGRARNKGAASTTGKILVFVDADTLVPEQLIVRIIDTMSRPGCAGGAVDVRYTPRRRSVAWYLAVWRQIAMIAHMRQGATQFCWRDAFDALGGYDPKLWMGEDVDFFWRLERYARKNGKDVVFIDDIRVEPSTRRFDRWPLSRIIRQTNPLHAWVYRRDREMWREWYDDPIR